MLAEFIKNLDYSAHQCVWLVGDDINIDILFAECDYEYTAKIDTLENYDLMDMAIGIKCTWNKEMTKEYAKFLQASSRTNWTKNLVIKAGLEHLDFAKKVGGYVVVFDKLRAAETKQLIAAFIKKYANRYDFNFDNAQLAFISTLANLHELIVCSLLKVSGIEVAMWKEFLSQEEVSWYKKMKENTLLLEGLSTNIMPVMQYMLRAGFDSSNEGVVRAGVLNYIAAAIKDGGQVYQLAQLFKRLV